MNKQEFLGLLDHPKDVAQTDYKAFLEILSNYPYFHTAHQLLLMNLKSGNPEIFDQRLRMSAIQVSNRHVLFNLLNNPSEVKVKENEIVENKVVVGETSDSQSELLEIDDVSSNIVDEEQVSIVDTNIHPFGLLQQPDFELDYETGTGDSKQNQLSQFDLIEKFIEENPAFVPNRLDLSESREDISVSSIEENEDIVSETLASVYAGQKLYDKAISMYEKLILKFPEKSTYFASRIEELRKNIK